MLSDALLIQTNGPFSALGGPCGDKVGTLMRHAATLEEVGFKLPRTFTLGMEWTARVRTALGSATSLDHQNFPDFLRALTPIDATAPKLALAALGNPRVLAVRSDAFGDSTGMGLYESSIICRTAGEFDGRAEFAFWKACLKVIQSHDSRSAVNFRRENGLPDGIAICLQAAVGGEFDAGDDKKLFGPFIAGVMQRDIPAIGQDSLSFEFGFANPLEVRRKYTLSHNNRGFVLAVAPHMSRERVGSFLEPSSELNNRVVIDPLSQLAIQIRVLESVVAPELASIRDRLFARHPNAYVEFAVNEAGEVVALQFADSEMPSCPRPEIDSSWVTNRTILANPSQADRFPPLGQVVANGKVLVDMRTNPYDVPWAGEWPQPRREYVAICPEDIVGPFLADPEALWGTHYPVTCFVVPIAEEVVTFGTLASHVSGALRRASYATDNPAQFALLFIREEELDAALSGATFDAQGFCTNHRADVAAFESDGTGAFRLAPLPEP